MKQENSQQNLINEYARDAKRGFAAIYSAYADRLMQYAIHSFRLSCEEAEDAVHEAFLPWVQSPEKMSRVIQLQAYLFASVRNACIRRAKKEKEAVLSEDAPAGEKGDVHLQADVAVALDKLPLDQREVVFLKLWGDLTFEEISQMQKVSLNTVSSRYRYALNKLKEILQWNP